MLGKRLINFTNTHAFMLRPVGLTTSTSLDVSDSFLCEVLYSIDFETGNITMRDATTVTHSRDALERMRERTHSIIDLWVREKCDPLEAINLYYASLQKETA